MNQTEKNLKCSDWFQIKEVEDGVFVIVEPGFEQSYLVNGQSCSALLDTGMGLRDIRAALKPLLKKDVAVFNTHWHFDHIGGNALFAEIGIAAVEAQLIAKDISSVELMALYDKGFESEEITFPPGFKPQKYTIKGSRASFTITDGDRYDLGERVLEAIATPGHTRGSVSFLDHKTRSLFGGDFVYRDTFFAQFDDSDLQQYLHSLERVLERCDEFERIYPAHGDLPVGQEFLNTVLDAFQTIAGGASPHEIDRSWAQPCHRHHFSGFDILIKPPGTRGIRLFSDA